MFPKNPWRVFYNKNLKGFQKPFSKEINHFSKKRKKKKGQFSQNNFQMVLGPWL